MTLASNVTSRYPNQLLVNLTNPNTTTAGTTINTTKLGLAADDVEADFEIHAGIEYDDSEPLHVTVATEGVIARLMEWTGHAGAEQQKDRYMARLAAVAQVTGRDRLLPTSAGRNEPTEPDDSLTIRPAFDDPRWDGLVPGGPA